MTDKKDSPNYFGLLARNTTMFQFFWIMLMQRLSLGAVIGNWIKMNMSNKFFEVEIKLTIKRKPTFKDKQVLKNETGLDLDEIMRRLNE